MQRSPQRWIAVGLTLAGTVGIGAAVDARSSAEITASFSDACRDFEAHSTKDISYVEIHYADDRVVRDETIDTHDYVLDGGPGDEIRSAVVKAARTIETFECQGIGHEPTALLETPSRCALGVCTDWTTEDSDGSHVRCSDDRESIPFRGINSTDLDGDIATWSIDFGDGSAPATGTWAGSPPIDVRHVFPNAVDLFTATLTLSDSTGQVGTDSIVVCLVDFTPD